MTIAMAPLRALVVAMLGAAIAWSWFEGGALVPLIIAAVLTVVAIGSQVWGLFVPAVGAGDTPGLW